MIDPPRFVPPKTSSTASDRRQYHDLDAEPAPHDAGSVLTTSMFTWSDLGPSNDSPGLPAFVSSSGAVFLVPEFHLTAAANTSGDVLDLLKRAEELRALPPPGRPAPSTVARLVATSVLPETLNHVVPNSVTVTSDGGIMFYFLGRDLFAGRRYASLEVHEGGELVMLQSDREAGSMPSVEDVSLGRDSIGEALHSIRSFIDPACQDQ